MLAAACCLLQSCDEEEDCSLNARPMMNCNILAINEETGHYEQAAINQLTITAFGTDSEFLLFRPGISIFLFTLSAPKPAAIPGSLCSTPPCLQKNTPLIFLILCLYYVRLHLCLRLSLE